jgi:tetratricopeptide (TPR) repeat protein
MRYLFSLLFLFVFFSSPAQPADNYKDVDALIATNSMIDAMTAIKKLKEEHTADTLNGEYWLRFSKASYTFYKYDDAKKAIDRAILLNPSSASYYFEKGLLLNRTGDTENALAPLEKAVSLDPKPEHYYWKGIVGQQLENNATAEADYMKALEGKFETAGLYNNLAIILIANGKAEKALEIISKAIAFDNSYAQAYSARSKINILLANIDSAYADMKRANLLGYNKTIPIPDSIYKGTEAQRLRFSAEVAVYNLCFQPAITAYDKLEATKATDANLFLNRGFCHYKLKEYEAAEKDYLQALTYKPDNSTTDLLYDNLSLLYFDMNNFSKSAEYSGKRITLNPSNHVPYIDRGLCYRKMKKYKEAEKDFNKSLEIKPDFFRAFGYRSFLFLELGQYQKAYDDASKSISINPQYAYGYLVRGQAKKELGMPDYCTDLYTAKKFGMKEEAEATIRQICK